MLKCTVKNASKMQGNIKQKALMKIQTKLRVQKMLKQKSKLVKDLPPRLELLEKVLSSTK